MSKKLNFGTINAETINTLSAFSVAIEELKRLRTNYKSACEPIEEHLKSVKEERQKAIEGGMSTDDAISKYSIVEDMEKLNALKVQYEKDCEPHTKAKKEAQALVTDGLYYAYVLTQKKGSFDARGNLTIKRGKKEETIKIEKPLKSAIADFLESIGVARGTDTQMDKFSQSMTVRVSGSKKCNKGENYINEKSASQFKELFMLAFLQYTIIEKGVIIKNEDNTLTMRNFDAE